MLHWVVEEELLCSKLSNSYLPKMYSQLLLFSPKVVTKLTVGEFQVHEYSAKERRGYKMSLEQLPGM